ncbi:juvenile hormone esterase-like [Lutzomyia longipalpis]|uniref:juvenile hormone esterase-like n=1 Tax=Lutzomyia longipalpis TaxID=7200 RepID=UPI002483A928|nr:juvenile hormone esterase-like [Lutzomyia longipalpis]
MKFLEILIFFSNFLFQVNSKAKTPLYGIFFARTDLTSPEVCAKVGCFRGKFESGRVRPYEAFYGIPYAEPPLGDLRFEKPIPHRGWTGYWDATYARDACMQRNIFLFEQPILGSEDCLYLNVYRPNNWKKAKKLPVIVWIHGGATVAFSSDPEVIGPEYLMDNGEVILVTLNYRLGFFGFLCSGDEAVKGNFGVKDQQLAIKWVAANIEYFGGDPDSITLGGESSGAAATHLHMLNPVSRTFFHRVMLMSGSALNGWAISTDCPIKFRLGAKYSGLENWETGTTYELANELKKLDALTLVLALDKLFVFLQTPPGPLRPCIEGDWEDAFLKEHPRKIWLEGRYGPKPIFIGTTSDEGTLGAGLTTNETILKEFNENIYEYIPIQLDINPRYMGEVIERYLGGKDYIDESNVEGYYQLYTDKQFIYPMVALVEQYLQHSDVTKNPIFIYEFAFRSAYTFVKFLTGQDIYLGVSHIDDLFFLFSSPGLFTPFTPDSPEGHMADTWVRTVVNFVVRGEMKFWRKYTPCTPAMSIPFCDRQIFQRYEKMDPNQVNVSVSNKIDTEMIKFWAEKEYGVDAITFTPCF